MAAASPVPASAQSLLESLFGWSGPKPARAAAPIRVRPVPPNGEPYYVPGFRGGAFPPGRSSDQPQPSSSSGGRYTTMCVRMCDGFYFPISQSTSRQAFRRDAAACQDRCPNVEARLFYRPVSSSNMKDAVDLTGLSYGRLPIAFKHRKTFVQGCACRPAPWSATERARHRAYAAAEGIALPPDPRLDPPIVIAGRHDDTSKSADRASATEEAAPAETNVGAGPVEAPSPTVAATAEEAAPPPAPVTASALSMSLSGLSARRTPAVTAAGEARPSAHKRRQARAQARPPRRSRQQPQPSVGGLFGTAQQSKYSSYTWPGDRPTRYR